MASFHEVCHILKKDLFVLFIYMCVCAYMCLQVPTEARGHCPPGTGATGTCEPPDVGPRYQTLVSVRAMRSRKR